MSVTDAEKAFYESVIAAPVGHSIQDLRYAYFLAAVDGGLPAAPVEVPGGIEATGTPSATTYLRGDGTWQTPPNTTYPEIAQLSIETTTGTSTGLISGRRFNQGLIGQLKAFTGYNAAVEQHLIHDASGNIAWADTAS